MAGGVAWSGEGVFVEVVGGGWGDGDFSDGAGVGFEYADEYAFDAGFLAWAGYASELRGDESADGDDLGVGGPVGFAHAFAEFVEGGVAVEEDAAVFFLGGVFFDGFADEFVDDVAECDDALDAAVFIDEEGELGFFVVEHEEELVEGDAFGCEDGGSCDESEDGAVAFGVVCGEEFLGVYDADDVVHAAVAEWESGVEVGVHDGAVVVHGFLEVEVRDADAGDHDLFGASAAEGECVEDE